MLCCSEMINWQNCFIVREYSLGFFEDIDFFLSLFTHYLCITVSGYSIRVLRRTILALFHHLS